MAYSYAAVPTYGDWFAPAAPPAGGGGGGRKPPSPDPWGNGGSYVVGTGPASSPGYTDPTASSWGTPSGGKAATTPQWDNDGRTAWGSGQPDPWGWTNDYQTGVFNSPGYDEQWYREHAKDYDQPSAAEQYWNGMSGQFAAGPERATGAQKGYDTWFDTLSTPGFTAAGAGTPHGTNYGGAAYGQRETGPSRSEVFMDSGGPVFSKYGEGSYGAGANRTTFDTGRTFDRFFEPLSQESNSERLYGTDPGLGNYYDRASEVGTEKLRNAAAARGMFNSGTSMDEERELAKDLGAERANREADYMLRAAGQSDSERRARMGLAGELANAADTTSLGRSANERSWVGMLDDNSIRREQEKRAGREFADTFGANRDIRNMNWADMLDKGSLARSAEDRAWATSADEDRARRSGESRNWSDLLDKGTSDYNKSKLDYLTAGGTAAAASDAGKYGRLADQKAGAVTAQKSLVDRYQNQFDNLYKMASAKAGLVTGAVDSATKEKADMAMARIKATLAKAKAGQELSQQEQSQLDADLALAFRLYKTVGTGGAGGAGGGVDPIYNTAITDV